MSTLFEFIKFVRPNKLDKAFVFKTHAGGGFFVWPLSPCPLPLMLYVVRAAGQSNIELHESQLLEATERE